MAREAVILLFWDCPECGHAHIEGPTFRCPRCFWWRDRDLNFYEAPDSRVLTPEEVEQFQRPNWICKVCGAANPDKGEPVEHLLCGSCNQWQTNTVDLGQTRPDALGGDTVETVEGQWQEGFRVDPAAFSDEESQEKSRPRGPKKPVKWGRRILLFFTTLLVSVLGWCGWQFFQPDYIDAQVLSRSWTVTVQIQELRPVNDSGWTLPSGAYNVQRSQRQRSTRQVQVGTRNESVQVSYKEQTGTREECATTSRGDGTGTRTCRDVPVYTTKYRTETKEVPVYRSEPVYDTWYSYTVPRWVAGRAVNNNGTGDQPRQPPTVNLTNDPYRQRTQPPVTICRLGVRYYDNDKNLVPDTWQVPCGHYERLEIGDVKTFERSGDRATLVEESGT